MSVFGLRVRHPLYFSKCKIQILFLKVYRANLKEADLSKANLELANLSQADLRVALLRETNLDGAELEGARLDGAKLTGVWLREAKLSGAFLRAANLKGARLSKADLAEANLSESNLSLADLSEANLTRADLSKANLSESNLSLADLGIANLSEADLSEANLDGADLGGTIMGLSVLGKIDLSKVKDLESVNHHYSSTIGIDTIRISKGIIPERFLRGCGLSDWEIESAKLYNPELSNEDVNKILYKIYDVRASQAIQVSPLFISYSHGDALFVDKLESHLNKKGVRFWRDVHDATAGRLEKQIDRAMRLNPTVLLILSEHSIQSDWVEHEVRTARTLEKEMRRDVLCPVALDASWQNSTWSKRVMEQVMEYNILDFSTWKDDTKFGGTFNKLIDGLELFYK